MANAIALQEFTSGGERKPRAYPLLRRASRKVTDFRFKDLHIDLRAHRVWRKLGLQHEIQTVFKVGYRLNTLGTL